MGRPFRHSTLWLALAVALLLGGVYGLTAGGHPDSSDGEAYFQQARSLLRGQHGLEITADNGRITPSRPGRDGQPAAVGGIGYPAAMVPLVGLGTLVAQVAPAGQAGVIERLFASFTNPLLSALTAAVLLLAAIRLGASTRGAVLLALAYGLGTMAWPYSGTFFSEPLASLLVAAAVLGALRAADTGGIADVALAGLAAGGAGLARPSALIIVPIVGAFLVWRRRRTGGLRPAGVAALAYVVAATAAVGLASLSSWWRYGSGSDSGYGTVPLDASVAEGLYGLLLSPGKSLFLYAPLALVALVAVPQAFRHKPSEVVMLGAIVVVNLGLFARFPYWHGDQAWGPRYLQITLPALVLLLAPVLGSVNWRRAAAAAGVVGLVPALLGTLVSPNQYAAVARESISDAVAADGAPAYWHDMHFSPRSSPLVGHAELLSRAILNAGRRLDGPDASFAVSGRFPETASQRYFWYHQPAQLDVWPYWVVVQRSPGGLLLLALIPLAGAVAGARMLRGRVGEPA